MKKLGASVRFVCDASENGEEEAVGRSESRSAALCREKFKREADVAEADDGDGGGFVLELGDGSHGKVRSAPSSLRYAGQAE